MMEHPNINIIANLYGKYQYTTYSKSFNEFWNDRIFDDTEDTFFIFGKEFIVFQNIKPVLLPEMINHEIDHISLKIFNELSKKRFKLKNLIALFFWKGKTITEIETTDKKKEYLYKFESYYKEKKRRYRSINDKDFTHMITITFQHPTTIKHPIYIMNYNRILKSFINQGLQRQRVYIEKTFEDKLKKVIRDPKKRRETAKKLRKKYFKYTLVIEIHENGFLHAHFLMKLPPFLRNRDFKELIRIFAKWYNTSEIGVDIKYLKKKNKKRAFNYVNKYLRKQYQEPAIFKVIDEDRKVYYLIDKKRFYLNDIPRIQSYSRNCNKNEMRIYKSQKCISVRELDENNEIDKTIKEQTLYIKAERYEAKIDQIPYIMAREDIERFKRLKAKREARKQIKIAEKRREAIEILEKYTNGKIDIINNEKDFRTVLNALDFLKQDDREIKKHYNDLIGEAIKKFRKDLFIIDVMPPPTPERLRTQQQEEETEWIEF